MLNWINNKMENWSFVLWRNWFVFVVVVTCFRIVLTSNRHWNCHCFKTFWTELSPSCRSQAHRPFCSKKEVLCIHPSQHCLLQEVRSSLSIPVNNPIRRRWSSGSMPPSRHTRMPTAAPSWRRASWETWSPRSPNHRVSLAVQGKEPSHWSWARSTRTRSRPLSKSLVSTWWPVTWSHWTEASVTSATTSKSHRVPTSCWEPYNTLADWLRDPPGQRLRNRRKSLEIKIKR